MNKPIQLFIAFFCLSIGFILFSCDTEKVIQALVVAGGHDYDKEGFEKFLAELPVKYDRGEDPDACAMAVREKLASYDVVLLL
jgi:hypothetical protein